MSARPRPAAAASASALRSHNLRDLKKLRQQWSAAQAQAEAAARAAAEAAAESAAESAAARQQKDQALFARALQALGAVQPLKTKRPTHTPAPQKPLPAPRQRQQDEQAALREALSDEFDSSTLLETDEHLSFRRPGIGADVITRLRRGLWAVQGQIDLHGLRVPEARQALALYLQNASRAGLRCVRVVHGKGHGSPGRVPVLRSKVHAWLIQKSEVMAFVQARPLDGGAGALLVLLKPGA